MLKDDWLMNLIRQSIQAIQHVLGLIDNGEFEKAEEAIGETAEEYLGLPWQQMEAMTVEELDNFLGVNEQAGIGQMIMLADLLRSSATIALQKDDEDAAYQYNLKALEIRLRLAIGHDLSNAHLDNTVDELTEALSEYVLPTPIVEQLMTYYEKTTQFDKAENYLWELIEDHITDEDMVTEGLAFYERLLLKNDSELRTGNVTRTELEEGFNELWEAR